MVNTNIMMKANVILHGIQGFFSVVIMGVIGVGMTQKGSAGGPARFMFALCWFNIPAIIYLTMAPRFSRTKHLAHPYWTFGVNTLFSIFWFAAFVAVSVYTNKGIAEGEKKEKDDKKKKQGGCAVFEAGTGEAPKACQLNKSGVGLGVFMWFLWLATLGIAVYAAWYYKKHTVSPFDDFTSPSHEIQESTKDAFSSNDEYAPINHTHGHDDYDDETDLDSRYHGRSGSVASSTYHSSAYSHGESAHPGRPVSWAAERDPYPGIGGHAPIAPVHGEATMPEAPDDYSYRGARV